MGFILRTLLDSSTSCGCRCVCREGWPYDYVASQSSALTGVEHQAHTDPADIVRRVTGNIVIIIRDKTVSFRSRSLTITGDHS